MQRFKEEMKNGSDEDVNFSSKEFVVLANAWIAETRRNEQRSLEVGDGVCHARSSVSEGARDSAGGPRLHPALEFLL